MERKYMNTYLEKENYVELSIYGLKYEAILLIEKEDAEKMKKLHWGLMSVGRDGNKKIVPYTTINRVSIPLGRWLMSVNDTNKRVEHYNRDNHNFLKDNLYIIGRHDYKKQVSKNNKDTICGVFEIKQKNGKVSGYKIQITNDDTDKKEWVSFNASQFNSLAEAQSEAIKFKERLIQKSVQHIA